MDIKFLCCRENLTAIFVLLSYSFFYFTPSYRFEDIFIDRKGVNKLQSELERYITRAVETNMKYDTQDSKHLQHYVARKKRRKWRR